MHPNFINKKILSITGYTITDKHIAYSNQCYGAVHPILHKIEENMLKFGTILLLSIMTMACKILRAGSVDRINRKPEDQIFDHRTKKNHN